MKNMEKIKALYEIRDCNGITNRENIEKYQQVICRIKTTDKNKSFEESE